ncbi:MAG: hypothetical protein C5B46_09090 [Proteobacteria bacterium]|nr:MAG: hypothetical protein C5B46_09090 [Pseudomonadota bacterium]
MPLTGKAGRRGLKSRKRRGGDRREWSRRSEAASLELPKGLLAAAQANTRLLGESTFLALLAHEAAQTRAPELTRAYRNVVAVGAGMKKIRRRGVERLTSQPCVVFVVRRKWTVDQTDIKNPQHLPRWLVVYAEHQNERKPFAVATDVQPETGFFGTRPHGDGGIWLDPPDLPWTIGAIACAVEVRRPTGSESCLMSAQHVFTPEPDVDALRVSDGLRVMPLDTSGARISAPTVARTRPLGGLMRGEEDPKLPSFDVQLARLEDLASARRIVGAPSLSATEPWISSFERLVQLNEEHWLQLIVPQNHPGVPSRSPLRARIETLLPLAYAIQYDVRRGEDRTEAWLYHEGLVKLEIKGSFLPLAGDSGSAVIVQYADGSATLVGLYIGGNEASAFIIPAWQLFDPRRYWSLPSGTKLVPVSL